MYNGGKEKKERKVVERGQTTPCSTDGYILRLSCLFVYGTRLGDVLLPHERVVVGSGQLDALRQPAVRDSAETGHGAEDLQFHRSVSQYISLRQVY